MYVEKVFARLREPFGSGAGFQDGYFDEYRYKEMIAQQGALEPAADYIVS